MKRTSYTKSSVALAISALLAGCGGSRSLISAPGTTLQGGATATHADSGGSWMLPEAKNEDLLYLADAGAYTNNVSVYSFPKLKLVGQFTRYGRPFGECVDASGNVYIIGGEIDEYAHGGTVPIRTLSYPSYNIYLWGCSIDPRSGNLAVTAPSQGIGGGEVLVYAKASGSPTAYHVDVLFFPSYCAYDDRGNLYVLVIPSDSYRSELQELPYGASKLRKFYLAKWHAVNFRGGIQWVRNNMLLEGSSAEILSYSVSGRRAAKKGSTAIAGSNQVGQFWVQGNRVVVPSEGSNAFDFYTYPQGVQIKTIAGGGEPVAAVVSTARSR